jgi:alpha-N-acetylglucosamine transferase
MKTAYVSTLCNGDAYAPGVEVLGKSLEATGTAVPRIVMVTPDIDRGCRASLERQGWQTRDVEPIGNPTAATELLFPRFAAVFTKLRAWELTEFERVVLLDADTLVLQNVDDLFERRSFAAGPDFFLPDHFNSGVMVLEPSSDTFQRMTQALALYGSYDGGDQGFLNTFFPDWYAMPAEHRLPVGYNMAHFIYQFLRGHQSLKAKLERDVKILHYMVQKPWQSGLTLTGGSAAWWKTYYMAHPEKAGPWQKHVHTLEDWSFDKLASLVLD